MSNNNFSLHDSKFDFSLISQANAQEVSSEVGVSQEVAKAAPEFSITSLVPLILIFAVFYFLIIRPQTKKHKEQQQILSGLKVGNKVITSSGIIGIIRDFDEKENLVHLEIAESVIIKIIKSSIIDIHQKELKIDKKNHKKDKKNNQK